MSLAYVDTSCLVAVAFGEPEHAELAAELRSLDAMYASNLLEAELRAALQRERSTDDGALLTRVSWVIPDRPLSNEIRRVLAAGYLRGADLWHLACALYLSPEPEALRFMTRDRRQAEVAASLGFVV